MIHDLIATKKVSGGIFDDDDDDDDFLFAPRNKDTPTKPPSDTPKTISQPDREKLRFERLCLSLGILELLSSSVFSGGSDLGLDDDDNLFGTPTEGKQNKEEVWMTTLD